MGVWVAIAAATVAVAAGFAWRSGRLVPAPAVVVPAAPELLDPEVRRLVENLAAEAREKPREAARHGRLGLAYEANGLWGEARESYAHAVRLAPDEKLWRFHHAVATQEAGDAAAAVELYRALAARHPGFAPLEHRLGLALLERGELEAALAAFERLVESVPGEAAGHAGAGAALLAAGDPAAAARRLERALELEPGHREARYRLGLAYRALGRQAESARALARGLEARPRPLPSPLVGEIERYAVGLPARVERAERLRREGRVDEAIRVLAEALRAHPDNVTLLNNLATAHLSRGDGERAETLLQRALALGADDPETRFNLAGWALAAGRPAEALEHAERALAAAPALARLHAVRAQALIGLRRYAEATASMERALELEVRDPSLYLGLGVLYESAGRWREAKALYERAVGRWPELAPAHLGLAECALALGDPAAAEAALAAARRLEPELPRLGEVAERLDAARRRGQQ